MQLKIANKEYEVLFGLKFISELDAKYRVGVQEYHFGMGVQSVLPYLEMRNPLVLPDLIMAGTATASPRPTRKDVEAFVETEADIEELCELFIKELQTQRLTQAMVRRLQDQAKRQQGQKNT